jgi:hypothetical protein
MANVSIELEDWNYFRHLVSSPEQKNPRLCVAEQR